MANSRATRKSDEKRLSEERAKGYCADNKITSTRQAISSIKSIFQRQTNISKKDPVESIPVVLQILIEIRQALALPLAGDQNSNIAEIVNPQQKTFDIVDNAVNVFGETDRIQQLGMFAKMSELGKLDKDETVAELENLVVSVDNITLTADTVNLWAEVGIWLEGIYRRTADKIEKDPSTKEPKREADGSFPRVDPSDWAFYKKTGLTKMEISLFYHRAAEKISAHIKSFQEELRLSQQVSMPPEIIRKSSVSEEENEDGFVENKLRVVEDNDNLIFQISIPKQHADFLQDIADVVNDMLANPLVNALRKDSNSNTNARISNFESALGQFGLTAYQKVVLQNFRDDAIAALDSYKTQNTIRNWVWYPAHHTRATDAVSNLRASDDPQDHIIEMLDLRRYLIGQSSVNLLGRVNDVLLTAIQRLCPQSANRMYDMTGEASIRQANDASQGEEQRALTKQVSQSSVFNIYRRN